MNVGWTRICRSRQPLFVSADVLRLNLGAIICVPDKYLCKDGQMSVTEFNF